jgi:hypothetical protein
LAEEWSIFMSGFELSHRLERVRDLKVEAAYIGMETVEHDYRLLFATRPLPRFPGHGPSIEALRRSAQRASGFRVALDVIASGDEDVVARRSGIRQMQRASHGKAAARHARPSSTVSARWRPVL